MLPTGPVFIPEHMLPFGDKSSERQRSETMAWASLKKGDETVFLSAFHPVSDVGGVLCNVSKVHVPFNSPKATFHLLIVEFTIKS